MSQRSSRSTIQQYLIPLHKLNTRIYHSPLVGWYIFRRLRRTSFITRAHILASNIVKHLDEQGLMYDLQHGFRERRSCETQLIMLIEDLARNASVGRQTDIILLDFSKAFDKVNHSKLIWKGTSRQRSGKGAIRKRFPLQKPRWEKTKLTIRYFIP